MKTCTRLLGAPQAQQEASSSLEICLRMVSETCKARAGHLLSRSYRIYQFLQDDRALPHSPV